MQVSVPLSGISSFIAVCLLLLPAEGYAEDFVNSTYENRVTGMLYGSIIGDALAGPHEGRTSIESQRFLESGGWIAEFSEYSKWFQHYWNVYPRNARPGTYTDDNRLRLAVARAMILQEREFPGETLNQKRLAQSIFNRYADAQQEFQRSTSQLNTVQNSEDQEKFKRIQKERFLDCWFWWELSKTATAVFIPENGNLRSPNFKYRKLLDDQGFHTGEWELEPKEAEVVRGNIKSSYHFDSYARGEEMPLGEIALLPLAAYFPGAPAAAFRFFLDINFLDIASAPYYAAFLGAVLADLLGGTEWSEIRNRLEQQGIRNYVEYQGKQSLEPLELILERVFKITEKYRFQTCSRKYYKLLIRELHDEFARGEEMMCHIDEMLAASIALLDSAPDDVNEALLRAVNYGRDNDTVASITGCFLGAVHGADAFNQDWKNIVQTANPSVDIARTGAELAGIGITSK